MGAGGWDAHFSYQVLQSGHRLALLVACGWWGLAIPVLQLLKAPQVEQGFKAQTVVLYDSEVLILNSTAHLEQGKNVMANNTLHTHTHTERERKGERYNTGI